MTIPYLDDIIVHSPDVWTHLVAIHQVLEAHREAGLKLQRAKCAIFQTEEDYPGHVVSARGIKSVPGYVMLAKK